MSRVDERGIWVKINFLQLPLTCENAREEINFLLGSRFQGGKMSVNI